jgi:hypothetical protein
MGIASTLTLYAPRVHRAVAHDSQRVFGPPHSLLTLLNEHPVGHTGIAGRMHVMSGESGAVDTHMSLRAFS